MAMRGMDCCGIKEFSRLSDLKLTRAEMVEFLQDIKDDLTDEGHYDSHYDHDAERWVQGEWIDEVFRCPAFVVFSQAGNAKKVDADGAYGDYFAAFIESEGLGTVIETEPRINRNSGNLLKVFLWTVDQEAFKNWTGAKPARKRKVA